MHDCKMITNPDAVFSEDKIYIFTKNVNMEKDTECSVEISAEARYKMYVNGELVGAGPLKGSDKRRYYDSFNISLKQGENTVYIEVLQLRTPQDLSTHRFLTAVYRRGEVWVAARALDKKGNAVFETDDSWDTCEKSGTEFIVPEYSFYAGLPERAFEYAGIKTYSKAKTIGRLNTVLEYGENDSLVAWQRPIPMLTLYPESISLTLNSVFDYGVLTTGYVSFNLSGKGKVKVTYAERYKNPISEMRTFDGGDIFGDYDIFEIDGDFVYEPFWFRCFRFLKIESSEDIKINSVKVIHTQYPLVTESDYDFGNDYDNKLWDMSLRTLKLCMHETYEDCPYYEQLQYAMDTYLQMLFTYQLSDDDRLARKAITDFRLSVSGEGLTRSRTPSAMDQTIPGFALFYIMMVTAHFERFGDAQIISENLPVILGIFMWYQNHLNGRGIVEKSCYWHFVDWADGWEESHGVPGDMSAKEAGAETLMLAYTYREVSKVLLKTGRKELGAEFESTAKKIISDVMANCYVEEKGLFADDETKRQFSQHMQVWAVLSGCAQGELAERVMTNSFSLKSKSSFAFAYFLFRALEKTGMYEKRKDMLNSLYKLVDYNCSTVPETPTNPRSECHGWGAVVLYEYTARDIGVWKTDYENKTVYLKPYTAERDSARGSVYTRLGRVYVKWEKKDGKLYLEYDAPDCVKVEVQYDGEIVLLKG